MVLQHPNARKLDVEIRVDGTLLKQVSLFKYLGFMVTPGLSFTAHITRATERARAAAYVTAQLLTRLAIQSLKRTGIYFQCYVESQFYGLELLPSSVAKNICSLRSLFVRSVFDLPRSTSHELAVVLLDLPPVETVMLQRKKSFFDSTSRHSFPFVRGALSIDLSRLLNQPLSWHHGLVVLLRTLLGEISTVNFNAGLRIGEARALVLQTNYNYFYIRECTDSDSLSFYRLFSHADVLSSFREFLESLPFPQRRLIVLFSSSLFRFRFTALPCEFCPLCGKRWLWEHFFNCPRLDVVPVLPTRETVLSTVQGHIADGEWDVFVHYLRFYLLEWSDILSRVIFPRDIIDNLCV
jgi:hypothetical protein